MNMIKFGVLALSLVLVSACGNKEDAAAPAEPATVAAPEPAPAQEAAPAAMENAATPVPADGSPLDTEQATTAACPTGCRLMNCPPPNGATACCKQTSTGYQKC